MSPNSILANKLSDENERKHYNDNQIKLKALYYSDMFSHYSSYIFLGILLIITIAINIFIYKYIISAKEISSIWSAIFENLDNMKCNKVSLKFNLINAKQFTLKYLPKITNYAQYKILMSPYDTSISSRADFKKMITNLIKTDNIKVGKYYKQKILDLDKKSFSLVIEHILHTVMLRYTNSQLMYFFFDIH